MRRRTGGGTNTGTNNTPRSRVSDTAAATNRAAHACIPTVVRDVVACAISTDLLGACGNSEIDGCSVFDQEVDGCPLFDQEEGSDVPKEVAAAEMAKRLAAAETAERLRDRLLVLQQQQQQRQQQHDQQQHDNKQWKAMIRQMAAAHAKVASARKPRTPRCPTCGSDSTRRGSEAGCEHCREALALRAWVSEEKRRVLALKAKGYQHWENIPKDKLRRAHESDAAPPR